MELSDFPSGAESSDSSARDTESGVFSEFLIAFDTKAVSLRVTISLAGDLSREKREPPNGEERELPMTRINSGLYARIGAPAVLLSVLCSGPAALADIVIDDFSSIDPADFWPVIQTSPGNILITEISLGNVLGGVRQTTITGDSFVSGSDEITVLIDPISEILNYDSTAGGDGALALIYSGFPLGLNSDFSGDIGIRVDFSSFGFGGQEPSSIPITVALDDGTNTITRTVFLNSGDSPLVFFNFSLFSGIGTFDLSTMDRVTVSIDPLQDVDFSIDLITTITIPAPGALALFGLAGMARRRRRMK